MLSHPRSRRSRAALGLLAALAAASACSGDDSPDSRDRVVEYLQADPYPRLVVEVDAVAGLGLVPEVVDPLVLALERLVDKPGGIEVVLDATLPASEPDKHWSFAELDALAERHFDLAVPADTVKIHVLVLDGSYHDDDGELLGLAWAHRHVALFQVGIVGACASGRGGKGLASNACRSAELGVLAHELGHVLGLVDNGAPMIVDHEDPEHPHHTADPDCLMYWAYERRAVVSKIQDELDAGTPAEEVLGFCPPSLADLAAARDGG